MAVVCLSLILLSLDADAQPTVDDESSQCGSASLQQVMNMVSVIASMKDEMQENGVEMRKMKAEISGVKNETNRVLDVLENVVNAIKTIVSNQQKTADELREMKRLNALVLSQVKVLLASNQSRACECVNSMRPSPAAPLVVVKQAMVSALVCEYQRLLSVKHYCTDSTLVHSK